MSEEKVINYRNVHKSDHLGVVDLEEAEENGTRPILTIDRVVQYAGNNKVTVAGRKINANIAHFVEDVKPLVVNATNGAILKKFAGSVDINKWAGLVIELYAKKDVKNMSGEVTGGVRIKPTQPTKAKEVLCPSHPRWADAVKSAKGGNTLEMFNQRYDLSVDNYNLMMSE